MKPCIEVRLFANDDAAGEAEVGSFLIVGEEEFPIEAMTDQYGFLSDIKCPEDIIDFIQRNQRRARDLGVECVVTEELNKELAGLEASDEVLASLGVDVRAR